MPERFFLLFILPDKNLFFCLNLLELADREESHEVQDRTNDKDSLTKTHVFGRSKQNGHCENRCKERQKPLDRICLSN